MKRAIAMSGVTYDHFSHYPANNHVELIKQVFQLDANATGADVLKFMQTAPTDLILQNAPFLGLPQGVVEVYWAPVIEGLSQYNFKFIGLAKIRTKLVQTL